MDWNNTLESQKFAGVTSRLHSLCCMHLTRKLRGPKGNSVAWSTALQAWGWEFDAQCFLHAKLCCLGFPNARSVLKKCVISSAHSQLLVGTETMMHNPLAPWNWMCWNTVDRNVSEHQRLLENTITNIYTSTRLKNCNSQRKTSQPNVSEPKPSVWVTQWQHNNKCKGKEGG